MEIQLWREILSPYEQAVTELVEKFQHLSLEHRERGLYSPIERVKSITSILEKMKRKNIPFEEMEEQVEDIAGIRIICQFVEDIQRVSDLIAGRSDMEIKCIKDYIAHQKERLPKLSSGYLLSCRDIKWPEKDPGRDSDTNDGNEFLGNHRAFSAV
mgnify:CR=1 FL=1